VNRVEENMHHRPVVFRDGALAGTNAWANKFFRDHHSMNKKEEK
jgi:hypothetical protein